MSGWCRGDAKSGPGLVADRVSKWARPRRATAVPEGQLQSDPKTWKRTKSRAVAARPMRRRARLACGNTQKPRLAASDRPDHPNLKARPVPWRNKNSSKARPQQTAGGLSRTMSRALAGRSKTAKDLANPMSVAGARQEPGPCGSGAGVGQVVRPKEAADPVHRAHTNTQSAG